MKKLSPEAQEVAKAALYVSSFDPEDHPNQAQEIAAAALRAAADVVVPWQEEPTEENVGPTIDFGYAWALFSKSNDIRQELIAIADELESI